MPSGQLTKSLPQRARTTKNSELPLSLNCAPTPGAKEDRPGKKITKRITFLNVEVDLLRFRTAQTLNDTCAWRTEGGAAVCVQAPEVSGMVDTPGHGLFLDDSFE